MSIDTITQTISYLDKQPIYIKLMIFNQLSLRDLLRMKQINKKHNEIIKKYNIIESIKFNETTNRMNWILKKYDKNTYHEYLIICKNDISTHLMIKTPRFKKDNIFGNNCYKMDNLIVNFLNKHFDDLQIPKYYMSFQTDFPCDCINEFGDHAFINSSIDMNKNSSIVHFCDYYNLGNLYYYISNNIKNMTILQWKSIFFQILFTLATIQSKYSAFRHNDLITTNIYLKSIPIDNNTHTYYLNGKTFNIPNVGLKVYICNFHFSCIKDGINNDNITNNPFITELGIIHNSNKYYDIHYLCANIKKHNYNHIPDEIKQFIDRIVPLTYYNKSNWRGRLLVNDEYTTPYDILMNDELFT